MLQASERVKLLAENMKIRLVSLVEPLKLILISTAVSASHNASLAKQRVGQLLNYLVLGEAVKFALRFQDFVNGFNHGLVANEIELKVAICVTDHQASAIVHSFSVCALQFRAIVCHQIEGIQVLKQLRTSLLCATNYQLLTNDEHLVRLEAVSSVVQQYFTDWVLTRLIAHLDLFSIVTG